MYFNINVSLQKMIELLAWAVGCLRCIYINIESESGFGATSLQVIQSPDENRCTPSPPASHEPSYPASDAIFNLFWSAGQAIYSQVSELPL